MGSELTGLLGETTLATSAAVVIVLLLRRPMRAAFGSGAAYALWALVPIALVAVLLPGPVRPWVPMTVAAGVGAEQAAATAPVASAVPATLVPMLAWVLGAVAMACLQGWQQRRFLRRLGPMRRHAHGLRVAATSAGLPAVTGVLRPRIVLPADFLLRYDADERALVVAHERQHIAHGDLPCNALVALLRCAYWFNPLLHWAVARYRHDQELACDARVLARHPRARRTYAQAMLKTQLDPFALPVGCHWHTHPIKERIAMLKRPNPRRWQAGLSSALLMALFAGGGYAAWAQQPATPRAVRPEQSSTAQGAAGKHVREPGNARGEAASATRRGTSAGAAVPPPGRQPPAAAGTGADAPAIQQAKLPYGVDRPPPRYPAEAARARISGKVVVIADVAADGHVTGATVEKSNPAGVFDEVSLEAVRKWTFKPAMKNGKPVAGRMRVPIDFEMDPPEKAPTSGAGARSPIPGRRAMASGGPAAKGAVCGARSDRTADVPEGMACRDDASHLGSRPRSGGKQVLFDVAADGAVSNLRLDTDRRPGELERAMMQALGRSRMAPAIRDGHAAEATFAADLAKGFPAPPGFMGIR